MQIPGNLVASPISSNPHCLPQLPYPVSSTSPVSLSYPTRSPLPPLLPQLPYPVSSTSPTFHVYIIRSTLPPLPASATLPCLLYLPCLPHLHYPVSSTSPASLCYPILSPLSPLPPTATLSPLPGTRRRPCKLNCAAPRRACRYLPRPPCSPECRSHCSLLPGLLRRTWSR